MTMSIVAPARRRAASVRSGCAVWSTREAMLMSAPRLAGERPRRDDALLRAAQLRRGDHLHRLRDLLRRLHGANAPAHVNE